MINQTRAEIETAFAALLTEREKVRRLGDLYLPRAQRARETVEFAYRRSAVYQLEAAVGGPLEP